MTEGDEDLETGTEDPLNHYYNRGLYIKDGYP